MKNGNAEPSSLICGIQMKSGTGGRIKDTFAHSLSRRSLRAKRLELSWRAVDQRKKTEGREEKALLVYTRRRCSCVRTDREDSGSSSRTSHDMLGVTSSLLLTCHISTRHISVLLPSSVAGNRRCCLTYFAFVLSANRCLFPLGILLQASLSKLREFWFAACATRT